MGTLSGERKKAQPNPRPTGGRLPRRTPHRRPSSRPALDAGARFIREIAGWQVLGAASRNRDTKGRLIGLRPTQESNPLLWCNDGRGRPWFLGRSGGLSFDAMPVPHQRRPKDRRSYADRLLMRQTACAWRFLPAIIGGGTWEGAPMPGMRRRDIIRCSAARRRHGRSRRARSSQ